MTEEAPSFAQQPSAQRPPLAQPWSMGTRVCVHVCSVCVCVCSLCAHVRVCVACAQRVGTCVGTRAACTCTRACAACGHMCAHMCSLCAYACSMCVRVCARAACICVCTRVQHVYVCVHACSMCVHVCTVRRVCTCVRACARLPCLHGALWAPRGPDCAPPRHRGCRSAPSSAQTRPDRVCPTSSLGHPFAASQWPVWSCSGRHFGKGQLSNSWQGRSRCVRKGEFRGQSWGPGGARAGREGGGGSSATQPQVRVLPVSAGM